MSLQRLDPRPFLIVLACRHWRQTAERPTGTTLPCGVAGCKLGAGGAGGAGRPRRILKVINLAQLAPDVVAAVKQDLGAAAAADPPQTG